MITNNRLKFLCDTKSLIFLNRWVNYKYLYITSMNYCRDFEEKKKHFSLWIILQSSSYIYSCLLLLDIILK